MTREEIYREIKEELGFVPTFFQKLPDGVLEHDWRGFKFLDLEETGALSIKERNLIGLGVAAAINCRYCILWHTETAKEYGATDDEINEALCYAADTAYSGTFLNGLDQDLDQFKDELRRIGEYRFKKVEKMSM